MGGRVESGRVRAAPVRRRVLEPLRQAIVSGRFAPGQKLPPRRELQSRFRVCPGTLQRAMDELVSTGFLRAAAGTGTFVAEHPPHLVQYGLVMHAPASERADSDTMTATIRRCWSGFRGPAGERIRSFPGVGENPDAGAYRELVAHLREQRLAGVIFETAAWVVRQHPELLASPVPKVFLGSDPDPGLATVRMDYGGMIARALAWLAGNGCRRLAVVAGGLGAHTMGWLAEAVAAAGMSMAPDCLVQYPFWRDDCQVKGQGLVTLAALLAALPADRRPECMLITDSLFLDPVLAGLAQAGVRVGQDLKVAAHANFPLPAATTWPVARIGFCMDELLAVCMESLAAQRRDPEARPHRVLPARFAWELAAPAARAPGYSG